MAAKTANVLAPVVPDAKEQAETIIARDEMDPASFGAMMSKGLSQAKAGLGLPEDKAFSLLHGDIWD